jgi:galactokinase
MILDTELTLQRHKQRFGKVGKLFAAPARVNLIGEHTDYTGGFVMPMAIGFRTLAVVSARQDGLAVFYSANYEEEVAFDIASLGRSPVGHWGDYPAGVLWCLREAGIAVSGFSMSLAGDVPQGAGLSSSASIEVATAMALLDHAGVTLPLEKIATLCRRAENEYVGAKSGIMDQFVVAGAVANRAMLLDCRSLKFELLPLPEQVRVVICNSMVKHAVATGEYGNRRDEVENGQAVLQRERPGVELLRDSTLADLEAHRNQMSAFSFARCRHIVTENQRTLEARHALMAGDAKKFGELMSQAHKSMKDDFAASCTEVDVLVEIALQQHECFGARITGGGFGGCTVNLVRADAADSFVETLKREYAAKTGIAAECFVSAPSDGALEMIKTGGGL